MTTLHQIDEYLDRVKERSLLCESKLLDNDLINFIVDALPEILLNDDFHKKLNELLSDKMSAKKIDKIAQVIINQLPTQIKNILVNTTL